MFFSVCFTWTCSSSILDAVEKNGILAPSYNLEYEIDNFIIP